MTAPASRPPVSRLLYSVTEAAAALGIAETLFRAEVLPSLPRVDVGTRVLVDIEDLRRWVDRQKDTASASRVPVRRGASASASTASVAKSPREKEIAARLSAKLERSTRRNSQGTASVHPLPVSTSRGRSPRNG